MMEAVQQQTGVWRNDGAHLAECAKSKCSGENACCKSDFVWVDCSFFRFLTFILPEYFILPCVKTLSTFCYTTRHFCWGQQTVRCWFETSSYNIYLLNSMLLNRRLFVSQLLQDYPIWWHDSSIISFPCCNNNNNNDNTHHTVWLTSDLCEVMCRKTTAKNALHENWRQKIRIMLPKINK